MSADIQVWETEDALLVIWGTHDANVAYGVSVDWYEANSEVPDDMAVQLLDVRAYWANPAVLDIDESPWPEHMLSRTPVDGWTPYMLAEW